MRSLTPVLLVLISVHAALNTVGTAHPQESSNQHIGTRDSSHDDHIPTVDTKLFNKRRYRSPRVLFSDVMPTNVQKSPHPEPRSPRTRRNAGEFMHRGEYSVCDSRDDWVKNMTHAIDIKGNVVTVLPQFRIDNQTYTQLFHETTCRITKQSSPAPRNVRSGLPGCRGIDNKHWNSYCTNTHTFVRALTSFDNTVAWRYIRINAACVCVLSRKSWRH